eukprot:6643254-Pyramimonas_sp.AAC.1
MRQGALSSQDRSQRPPMPTRQFGSVAGAHQRGRCLTTLLDVRAPEQDPGVRLPQLCLQQWLRTWIDYPSIRVGVRRVSAST